MPTTQQETSDVLKQLASMDNVPEDDPNDDTNLSIAPQVPPVQQVQPKIEGGPDTDIKLPLLPRVLGTAIKIEKPADTLPQKKVFKTVEYKLKRKYIKQRKFSCVGCNSSFATQKELNEHPVFHIHRLNVTCVKNSLTHQQLRHSCATNTNIMTTCMNVMFVTVASSLPANYKSIRGYIKHKVIGCASSPNVGKDSKRSSNSMHILCPITKRNINVTNVHTKTRIPAT